MNTIDLAGKVAVVLGAGSSGPGWGNGKACAAAFARAGAKVIAADVSLDAAKETEAIILAEGGEARAFRTDVTDSLDVRTLIDQTMLYYKRIDILHYNVGIALLGGCVELAEEDWQRAFQVNVTGCFLACKYALPIMEKQNAGLLLTTGSVAGLRWSGINYISYSTTKAAILHFTRCVAMQYASKGIRAVCLVPGLMNTPLIYGSALGAAYGGNDVQKMIETRNKQCPTGSMGEAWDVANAAVFLASDAAKYITATELLIDGGITAKFM